MVEEKIREKGRRQDIFEEDIRTKERELRTGKARRKQIALRLPESLWREIAAWAKDDLRSINGQIEYILTRSVKEQRK